MKKIAYGHTSKKVGSIAGKKLSDPNSTPSEKSMAGSCLVQCRWQKYKEHTAT